jgi:competence protein ComEC
MSYFISFIYGTAAFYTYKFFPAAAIILSLLLITLWLFYSNIAKETPQKIAPKNKIISGLLIVIIALFGFFYANARYTPETPIEEIAGEILLVKGIPASEAVSRSSSISSSGTFSQVVKIKEAFDKNMSPLTIKQLRLITDTVLQTDRLYHIKVRMHRYYLNPGSFKGMPSGHALRITDSGDADVSSFHKARQQTRAKLNNYIKNNFSEESAPFIMSQVTGERGMLPKEIRDAFSSTGLAHILSISGTHFGLLFIILFASFRFMIKTLPYSLLSRLTLYFTPSQITALLCIPFMAGYLVISDMSVPSVRAFIMINLFLTGLLMGRKGFWLNTLLFAAVVIILMHPDAITDLSFQLSFLAVLCIGMAVEQQSSRAAEQKLDNGTAAQQSNRAAERLEQFKRFKLLPIALLRYCSTALKISIAATIGTAMLVAYYFNYFSVVSPFTNVIITPFIGFIILPAALIASFIFLAFGVFPFHSLIDAAASFCISAITYIAGWWFVDVKIPSFPIIVLIMFYSGLLIYIAIKLKADAHPKFKYHKLNLFAAACVAILPAIIYLAVSLTTARGIHITFLDVGQGDSAVVELPDKKVLVVDTGINGFQTANFLRYRGIKKIDALVLSHGSSDHAGGLDKILNDFNVREVWDNSRLIYPEGLLSDGIIHRRLQRGDTAESSGYRITILHPYDGFYTMFSGSDENNDSLVIRIDGIKNSFLFTGDIEQEAQEDLWHLGGHLKTNVIKVPHHGSRTSASEIFFSAVSPDIAVISAGRKNRYGHPHDEMLQLLEGIRVLRTDTDGAIGIREMRDGSMRIKTWNDFRIIKAKNLRDELMNLKKLFYVW